MCTRPPSSSHTFLIIWFRAQFGSLRQFCDYLFAPNLRPRPNTLPLPLSHALSHLDASTARNVAAMEIHQVRYFLAAAET